MRESSIHLEEPPRSFPGTPGAAVRLERVQGSDTVAGLARRTGVPVATILGGIGPLQPAVRLGRPLTPAGSRLSGPC